MYFNVHVVSISYYMERCILDAVSVIHDFGSEPGGSIFGFQGVPDFEVVCDNFKKIFNFSRC